MGKKGEEHHGGAWKVAYADFVTAMMALFMVLWIISQDDEIVEATSNYFNDPFNYNPQAEMSMMDMRKDNISQSAIEKERGKNQVDMQELQEMAKEFMKMMDTEKLPEDERPIEIEVTSDGLKITLYDRSNKPLFTGDNDEFTQWGRFVMQNLSWLVDRHEMNVKIDAYSRAGVPFEEPDYSAWELTSDRANASRRLLEHYALEPRKVRKVSGHGTRGLMGDKEPTDESNSRVEVSLSIGEFAPVESEE